jgi:hypothetical protein
LTIFSTFLFTLENRGVFLKKVAVFTRGPLTTLFKHIIIQRVLFVPSNFNEIKQIVKMAMFYYLNILKLCKFPGVKLGQIDFSNR